MKYHGNYCGPNYSAGKHQGSTYDPSIPPIDDFDKTCLEHDTAYWRNTNLRQADLHFASQNIGKGVKRTLAGLAVGIQGLTRSADEYSLRVKRLKANHEFSTSSPNFDMPNVVARGSRRSRKSYASSKASKKKNKSSKKTIRKKLKKRSKRKSHKRKSSKNRKINIGNKQTSINGYQARFEYNGRFGVQNCIYLGWGTPASYIYSAAIRAIYKKLLMKAGMQIRNWSDLFDRVGEQAYKISIVYLDLTNDANSGLPARTSQGITVGVAGNTHDLVVANLEALHKTICRGVGNGQTTGNDYKQPYILYWELHYVDLITGLGVLLSKIDMENIKVHFKNTAILRWQNQTLSAGTGDITEDTTVVDRVPLAGKMYKSPKWQDGIVPYRRDIDFVGTVLPFKLASEGFVGRAPDGFTTDSVNNIYRKPPPAYMLGMKKATKFTQQPGSVLKDVAIFECTLKFNTILQKYISDLRTSTIAGVRTQDGENINALGNLNILAMEKLISPAAAEKDITLCFQLEHYTNCVASAGKYRTQPFSIASY